ncbi:MAG: response regulator transcription factor [Gammaproteobacteria bacterium]|jgi:DNA-binding NarL/FixJ family response regulator
MLQKKVLIADDHPIFREGLCAIISHIAGLEIIGEAENGQMAIEKARLLSPDIILMDLTMPVMNGTEAIRFIKKRNPAINIIALTAHRSHDYVKAALEAGANGYVLKDDTSASLLNAIESLYNGDVFLSAGVCNTVLTAFLGVNSNDSPDRSWCQLTVREREVIKLVAEGYKNREIAAHLSLSIKTFEKHRSSLMSKLGLHCTSALTTYAIEHSLISI